MSQSTHPHKGGKKSSLSNVSTPRQPSRDDVMSAPNGTGDQHTGAHSARHAHQSPDALNNSNSSNNSNKPKLASQMSRDDTYREQTGASPDDEDDGLERLNRSIEAEAGHDNSYLTAADDEGYNSIRKNSAMNFSQQLKQTAWGKWGPADYTALKIRGPAYLTEQEKIPARAPAFTLVHSDVLQSSTRIFHVAQQPELYVQKSTKINDKATRLDPHSQDFLLIVNFLVPSTPAYNLVCYFKRKTASESSKDAKEYDADLDVQALHAFNACFTAFVAGDAEYRNERFKLIPAIIDGANWFVKRTVGNKPAIIGTKIATMYHDNPQRNYLEIDIDVGSSSIGSGIFKVVSGYAKSVTLDLCFLIEGQTEEHLPEVLISGVRLSQVDVTKATKVESPKSLSTQKSSKSK